MKGQDLKDSSPEHAEAHGLVRRIPKCMWFSAVIVLVVFCGFQYFTGFNAKNYTKADRVRFDLRTMATALEAYCIDNGAYPAWTIGEPGANAKAKPGTPQAEMPTFRVKQGADDQLETLTTPVNYIDRYIPDHFAIKQAKGSTFAYWSFADRGWMLWSPGPDLDFDITHPDQIYDPSEGFDPRPELIQLLYDPTNGVESSGDIWRIKQ